MRNWRVLTAIAAVVLAALAGVLVWKYTENAKDDAKKPYTFETVLVAKNKIPSGTAFSAAFDGEQIEREQRVRNDLPDSTIVATANDTDLKQTYGTLVASHDIASGATVVTSDFVGQGAIQSSLGGALENDNKKEKKHLEAISVTLDDQHAVGGFLTPGDSVNVMVTASIDKDHLCQDASGKKVRFTAFLLPDMKVLAVGNTTSSQAATASTTSGTSSTANSTANARARSLLTFEVTPRQAEQLVQAQDCGTLYLSLNPTSLKPGDFVDPAEVVEAINLFDKPLPVVDQATTLGGS